MLVHAVFLGPCHLSLTHTPRVLKGTRPSSLFVPLCLRSPAFHQNKNIDRAPTPSANWAALGAHTDLSAAQQAFSSPKKMNTCDPAAAKAEAGIQAQEHAGGGQPHHHHQRRQLQHASPPRKRQRKRTPAILSAENSTIVTLDRTHYSVSPATGLHGLAESRFLSSFLEHYTGM